jgi:hypothetical protein
MIVAIEPSAPKIRAGELSPALKNPAVAHCRDVWELVHESTLKKKKSEACALIDASQAYCHAIPPLVGYENICNFIACVGYGMLTNIFLTGTGSKLLYAA